MPYTYTLTSVIPATPQEVYEAWLDSLAHSEMTGGEASMSDEVGGEFSAWDDYIKGRNLELVPGERIVQSWRTKDFTDEHEDSVVTLTFEEADDGTLLTLVHGNVPDDHTKYEESGWESKYFDPMRVYFANLAEAGEEQPAPSKPRAKPRTKSRAKSRAKSKRAAGRKAKTVKTVKKAKTVKRAKAAKTVTKAAPPAKKAARKTKRAAAKAKRAKPAARKAKRTAPKRKSARRQKARR